MGKRSEEAAQSPAKEVEANWGIGDGPDPEKRETEKSQLTNWITEEARIEPIGLYVNIIRPGFFHGPVTYRLYIEYTDHGRKDRIPTVSGTVTPPPDLTLYSWKHDFGATVQGGTIVARGELPYIDSSSGTTGVLPIHDEWRIRGKNPTKQAVKDRLGSLELQVIAYKESRFRQFDADGLPIFGPPSGFGVMQLDPPPSPEVIWNWKANVDAGIKVYKTKLREAKGYPARVRKNKFPEARDFNEKELKLEAYQRYNGGAYWEWSNPQKKWVPAPLNNYADTAYKIEQAVRAGKPPKEWD